VIEYMQSESDKEITQFWIDRCLRLEAENNELLSKVMAAKDEEREECAKVCEAEEMSDYNKRCPRAVSGYWPDQVAQRCADAIRMRSNV